MLDSDNYKFMYSINLCIGFYAEWFCFCYNICKVS